MLKKRSSNKLRRSSSRYHKKCSRPISVDDSRSRKPPLSNIPFKSWFQSSALIIMLQYMLIVCLLYGSSEFVQMIPSATATEPKARYDVRQYLHKGPHRPKESLWSRQSRTSSIAPRKLQSVEEGWPGPHEASRLPHRENQEEQSSGVNTFRVREVGHDVIGDDFILSHPQEGYVQESRGRSLPGNDHLEGGLMGRKLSSSAPSNAPLLQGPSSGEPHPLEATRLLLSQSNQFSLPTTAAAAAPAAKASTPNSSTPNALSTTKYDTYSSNPNQSSDKLFIPLANIGTGKTGCPTAGTNGCGQSSSSSPASALAVAATTPTTSMPVDTNAGGAILPSSFGSSGMNIYSSNPVTVNNPITISQPNIQKSADFTKGGSISPLQNILQEKKALLSGMALGAGLASLHKGLLP